MRIARYKSVPMVDLHHEAISAAFDCAHNRAGAGGVYRIAFRTAVIKAKVKHTRALAVVGFNAAALRRVPECERTGILPALAAR